jgi:hypothetical protein
MTPFSSTGGRSHATTVAVSAGNSYIYYISCKDTATEEVGNTTMTFSVASVPSGGGGGSSSSVKSTIKSLSRSLTSPSVNTPQSIATIVDILVLLGIIPEEKKTLAHSLAQQTTSTSTKKISTPPTLTKENIVMPLNFTPFTVQRAQGAVAEDVRRLQQFLNMHGFPVAKTGVGSLGRETNIFGDRTREALMRFQEAYRDEVLVPAGFSRPTGILGQYTMKKINAILEDDSRHLE